jgi:hypothetical protein
MLLMESTQDRHSATQAEMVLMTLFFGFGLASCAKSFIVKKVAMILL